MPGAWVLQGHGGAGLSQRPHAVRRSGAVGAGRQPDRVYRRTFTVPARGGQRRTLLRVGAANSMGFVWVNGQVRRRRHRQPPRVDVRRHGPCCGGARNTVCIVVPRWSAATWVEDQDQWWMPVCTAASSWCRCRRCRSPTRRRCPVSTPTARPAPRPRHRGRRRARHADSAGAAGHRRGVRATTRRRRGARPVATTGPRRRAPVGPGRRRSRRARGHLHLAGTPGAEQLRVPGIVPWNARDAAALPRASSSLRDADGRGDRRAHPLDRLSPGRDRRPARCSSTASPW